MARGVDDKMSFMEHLGELRVRIVRSLYALLAGTVPGLYFSQQIVDWLARPVTTLNYSLVFTSPAEALWVQMKVGLIVGVFISAPAILWQVWAFIAPGLHGHEKKYALPFVIIGSLLFVGGGAFSLFVVTPYAIQFLLSYARPESQVRDPRRLHRRRGPDAHARRVQPDADGRAADPPLRSRDHLRAHLRAQTGARAGRISLDGLRFPR